MTQGHIGHTTYSGFYVENLNDSKNFTIANRYSKCPFPPTGFRTSALEIIKKRRLGTVQGNSTSPPPLIKILSRFKLTPNATRQPNNVTCCSSPGAGPAAASRTRHSASAAQSGKSLSLELI